MVLSTSPDLSIFEKSMFLSLNTFPISGTFLTNHQSHHHPQVDGEAGDVAGVSGITPSSLLRSSATPFPNPHASPSWPRAGVPPCAPG